MLANLIERTTPFNPSRECHFKRIKDRLKVVSYFYIEMYFTSSYELTAIASMHSNWQNKTFLFLVHRAPMFAYPLVLACCAKVKIINAACEKQKACYSGNTP